MPAPDQRFERHRDAFTVSTAQDRLDLPYVHQFLIHAYWSPGVSFETVAGAVAHSLCFGLYDGDRQIGFARVVSDYTTVAYLADVFVDDGYRGQGLGGWLMECVFAHPNLQGLRRWFLRTADAHGLYARFGFVPLDAPETMMERKGVI